MKQSIAATCFLFSLFALLSFPFKQCLADQEIEPPHNRCDDLAGRAANGNRTVDYYNNIHNDIAISACLQAVHDFPTSTRFQGWLGSAYAVRGHYPDALKWLQKAADQGGYWSSLIPASTA